MKRVLSGSILALLLAAPFTGTTAQPTNPAATLLHLERSAEAMGSVFSVEIYGADQQMMVAAADNALAEARRLDGMLSNYIPSSELSRLNEHAADHPIKVSPELFALLSACQQYSRSSDGSFDISVGPLMKTWGFYRGSGHLPEPPQVRAALLNVGYEKIKLDPRQGTVFFRSHGVSLDPGGVGKGYAVDRMVAVLRSAGVTSALVSAGGSSIYGLGLPATDSRGWYVEIRDPRNENKVAATAYLHNQSLSTSGNYEKFFWAEGKLYSHIMNPRTGYPAEGMISVSVVSPITLDSEVWAKPFYILGRAWTQLHKPADFRVLLCEDKSGASCAWLQ